MLDIWVVTDTYEFEVHNFTHITESGARKNAIERIVSILWENSVDTEVEELLAKAGIKYELICEDDPQLIFEGMELKALRKAYDLLSGEHWDISNFSDVGQVELEHTRLQP